MTLGDLDGDNDGSGVFVDSGQVLGNSLSYSVALGDVDGDGDLDAWVANDGANRVWLNGGIALLDDNLESPSAGSFESGIGLIRSWACEADRIEVLIDGTDSMELPYGASRPDTMQP